VIETDLNKVLNYMKQYVENIYEHDSEPMLTWKDLKLVLDEIERLNNIITELEKYKKKYKEINPFDEVWEEEVNNKLKELKENTIVKD